MILFAFRCTISYYSFYLKNDMHCVIPDTSTAQFSNVFMNLDVFYIHVQTLFKIFKFFLLFFQVSFVHIQTLSRYYASLIQAQLQWNLKIHLK